jgi:hypothetical protein
MKRAGISKQATQIEVDFVIIIHAKCSRPCIRQGLKLSGDY